MIDTNLEELNINKLFDTYTINPQFNQNNIPIIFSCSNLYSRYCSVSIVSILENSDKNFNFDINILETNLSDDIKIKLKTLEQKYKNLSIRFINLKKPLDKFFELFYTNGQISKESYYRFFISEIFKNYDKVIYLDSDTIVNSDIVQLYNINLKNNLIAGTNDVSVLNWCITKYKRHDFPYSCDRYFNDILKINPVDYIQAGVLLMNISLLNNFNFTEKCILKLKEIKTPWFIDQDIINIICNGKILYLDICWNYGLHIKNVEEYKEIPTRLYKNIINQRNSIKILHMTGPKCDAYPHNEFSEIFWKNARYSPFYEILLFDNILRMPSKWNNELNNVHLYNISNRFIANEYNTKLNYVLEHMFLFKWIKFKYKIEKALSFGEKHERYKRKYKNVKQLIKDAKQLKKQFLNFNY